MTEVSRKEFDINRFIAENESAAFEGYLEPSGSSDDWYDDYEYLYKHILLDVKHVDLYAPQTIKLHNYRFSDKRDDIVFCIKNSKILIKARKHNYDPMFYDFEKINGEFRGKIFSIVTSFYSKIDEAKGLLIRDGWMNLGRIEYWPKNDIFKLRKHPENLLFKPEMKISVFGESFYIDLPDNKICKDKFNEWVSKLSIEKGIEAAIEAFDEPEAPKE